MKKIIFTFFSLVFSVLIMRAENVLTLTNKENSQTEVFRKGSYLVFGLKSDKSVREGFIRDITDSSLMFDDGQVSLSQIEVLAGSTKGKVVAGRIAHGVAQALIVAGMAVADCGWGFFVYSDSYYYWPIGGSIWLAGAFITGMGHIFNWVFYPFNYAVRVRNYRGWEAKIINDSVHPKDEKAISGNDSSGKQVLTKKEKRKKKNSGDDVYGE